MSEVSGSPRATVTTRLLWLFAVVFLLVITAFSAVVTNSVRTVLERQIIADVMGQARIAAVQLADDAEKAAAIASASGARLTIIDSGGSVVFDSVADVETMENHLRRPEVDAALNGREGTDHRFSASTGGESLYVAVPGSGGTAVRLVVNAEQLESVLSEVGRSVLAVGALAGVAGVLLVWTIAHRFTRPIRELTLIADQVAQGQLITEPRRSSLFELDRLGLSIGRISSELGRRITETEAERRTLDSVLGALPQGVILVSSDDTVLYTNPAASAQVGPLREKLSSAPRVLHRSVREARSSGTVQEAEFERGSPARTMSVVASRFADDDRVLAVISDVTESHRIEAMRRDFVADASHELKTPVAAVLASAEALQLALHRDPAKAAAFGERVEASARHLATIVADLLDLSRLESSEQHLSEVHLDAIVEEEVAKVRRRVVEAGIDLRSELMPTEMMGSRPDLALAVRNLIDNAIRYTDRGGAIDIALKSGTDRVILTVEDTGAGIPSRALGRVFERFYRVDEARSRDTGGTGLGLSIVRHVVERHGGTVTVTSQLGAGSIFRVELPR